MSIVLQLNPAVRDNYVFFCPEAPLHLSVLKPRGSSPRLSASILRGLRGKTLIDVNGVVDIKTGELKTETAEAAEKQAAMTEALKELEVAEEVEVVEIAEEKVEEVTETVEAAEEIMEEVVEEVVEITEEVVEAAPAKKAPAKKAAAKKE